MTSKNNRVLGLIVNDLSILEFHSKNHPVVKRAELPTAEQFANGRTTIKTVWQNSKNVVHVTASNMEALVRAAFEKHYKNSLVDERKKIPVSLGIIGTMMFYTQTSDMSKEFLPNDQDFNALVQYRNQSAALSALMNKKVKDKALFAEQLVDFVYSTVRDIGLPRFTAVEKTTERLIRAIEGFEPAHKEMQRFVEHLYRWSAHPGLTKFVPFDSQQQLNNWVQIRSEGVDPASLPQEYDSLFRGLISSLNMVEILKAYKIVLDFCAVSEPLVLHTSDQKSDPEDSSEATSVGEEFVLNA